MSLFRRRPAGAAAGWPYTVDDRDRVTWLDGLPQSDEGAPLPVVIATDFQVFLIYLVQQAQAELGGAGPMLVRGDSGNLPVAVIEFVRPYAHLFGPPNDEAIIGHPLASRGLHPCGRFTVEGSSWIRALERMNAVHPRHAAERFRRLSHYIVTFRDSTVECAANDLAASLHRGSLHGVVAEVATRLK
jgi:hypothetical protein